MPWKNFGPGQILTAADANNLMKQGCIIVADAAERNAIVATEGMAVYRLDRKRIERYRNGGWTNSAWTALTLQTGWTGTVEACSPDGITAAIRGKLGARSLASGAHFPCAGGALPAALIPQQSVVGSAICINGSTILTAACLAGDNGSIGFYQSSGATFASTETWLNVTYPLA